MVVVGDVLGQNSVQMSVAENQHPIKALTPDGADEALGEGIARGALTGLRMMRIPSALKTSSKLVVNLVSRSRIKSLTG